MGTSHTLKPQLFKIPMLKMPSIKWQEMPSSVKAAQLLSSIFQIPSVELEEPSNLVISRIKEPRLVSEWVIAEEPLRRNRNVADKNESIYINLVI